MVLFPNKLEQSEWIKSHHFEIIFIELIFSSHFVVVFFFYTRIHYTYVLYYVFLSYKNRQEQIKTFKATGSCVVLNIFIQI